MIQLIGQFAQFFQRATQTLLLRIIEARMHRQNQAVEVVSVVVDVAEVFSEKRVIEQFGLLLHRSQDANGRVGIDLGLLLRLLASNQTQPANNQSKPGNDQAVKTHSSRGRCLAEARANSK